MNWLDYRERLGIGFHDEEKTALFLSKAYCAFAEATVIDDCIDETTYNNFCYWAGIKDFKANDFGDFRVIARTLQKHTDNLKDFLYYYSIFLSSLSKSADAYYKESTIRGWLCKWAEECHLQFEFVNDGDKCFIFPKGAVELDNALVSEPLEWLNKYPQARAEFVQAIKDYSELTAENASDVADKFRKALERFFQEFFNRDCNLENIKSEYGKFMEDKGVPKELSNNLQNLLGAYTKFMNGYAKHHNKTSNNLLEYIMYQTGNIIRLMITLREEEE